MNPEAISSISTAADLRRVTILAAILGVAGGAAMILLGHPWMALFAFVGLGLGLLNAVLLRRAAAQYANVDGARKGGFALGSLGRLALISGLALGVAVLLRPDGLGVFIGLAAFQLLMVGAALVPLLKELKQAGTDS